MKFARLPGWFKRAILRAVALALFAAAPAGALASAAFGDMRSSAAIHAAIPDTDTGHGHSHDHDVPPGHAHDHDPADHAHETASLAAFGPARRAPPHAAAPRSGSAPMSGPAGPFERPPRG
jgi:predicted lipid-binding transport protein (Tim44 family)